MDIEHGEPTKSAQLILTERASARITAVARAYGISRSLAATWIIYAATNEVIYGYLATRSIEPLTALEDDNAS